MRANRSSNSANADICNFLRDLSTILASVGPAVYNIIPRKFVVFNRLPQSLRKALDSPETVRPGMDQSFTVVLTKGRYVVRESDAHEILTAIERKAAHVLVRADMLGDGVTFSPVRIVVQHVIAVVANEQPDARRMSIVP